jgi:biotin/methionine sulfoxide reductase
VTSALRPHSSHWGVFTTEADGDRVTVHPHPLDPDPSPLLANIPGGVRHRTRVAQPMIRAGWLDHGPGPADGRGAEPFVPVGWPAAIRVLADELQRVIGQYGPQAIYGGSYGWGSAGRFHHAQSQVHRFLNCLGGYTRSVQTYSLGASRVILPYVIGTHDELLHSATAWPVITANTQLVVCFGGIPLKNAAVNSGGVTRHTVRGHLREAARRQVRFVQFSPLKDDLPEFLEAEWQPLVPGTDVAVMLALAHVLVTEGLHDRDFLAKYCVGFERFERYLLGLDDGRPKSPEWAASLAQVPADMLRALARRMAACRTLVTVSWSLQRADHGEQVPWMGVVLAAMLGQIGLPGGGFGFGYGSVQAVGSPRSAPVPTLAQGINPVAAFIPVARISDMLLHPGEEYDYDGQRLRYPRIRLVYWCGGNPFHHHQDLGRLRRAFQRPDTIVVHEAFWTATARHADIVLPSTITLERNDIGASPNDGYLIAMHQAVPPYAGSRNDYDIFADLSSTLGAGDRFTEGRTGAEWIRYLYDTWRTSAGDAAGQPPPFDEFWRAGSVELPVSPDDAVLFSAFRQDPVHAPLATPSGRIEIFSARIHGFGYPDCPGHPAWLEPAEWLGSPLARRFPLVLIANNPRTRLHSQLDVGEFSQAAKIKGREPIRLHPEDAAVRGISDGDVVRVHNERGSCLAGAVISREIRRGVAQLSTGAWYDPLDPRAPAPMCVHGNPNALTFDKGTSRLAQGCSGQQCLVEIERWDGALPPVTVLDPPAMERRHGL